MNNPLVSIIIPNYNRAPLIGEMIDSVLAQTYTNWECIIVDDGSTDNSFEVVKHIVKNDKRFILVNRIEKHKKGGNGSRNYGLQLSKGEFVNWIDSDDRIDENFILEKVKAFNENTDVVISKTVIMNEQNEIIRKEDRTNFTDNLLDDFTTLKVSWYISDPLWRKSFLLKNNLKFSEKLLKGQDRDFHIRILTLKPKIIIIDKYLYFYRNNLNSISNLNSVSVSYSYLKGSLERNKLILKHEVKNTTKLFLLKQQLRTYSALHKQPKIHNMYGQVFKDLFVFTFSNIVVLFKFLLAVLAFKFFNKGDKILKSM